MASEHYPSGDFQPEHLQPYGPEDYWRLENVEPQILASARRENINLLAANYADNCNILRAAALEMLQRHTTSTDKLSWAIFGLGGEESFGDTIVKEPPVNVFVYTQRYEEGRKAYGQVIPYVRIITNEEVIAENGRKSVLCKDFSLLPDNIAHYYVGAISQLSPADSQAVPEAELIVPASRYTRHDTIKTDVASLAAFFTVNAEGKLRIRPSVENLTPLASVADYRGNSVAPFGDNTSFEDCVYALDQGKQLFDSISSLEPTLARSQTNL